MNYKTYEKYIDSNIEVVGEIPIHWKVNKLKNISQIKPSNIDKKSKEKEPPVLLCNYTDVYNNEFITNNLKFMKATASPDQIRKLSLNIGDIIITKDSESADDIAIPAIVTEELENVVCGYHLAVIRPNIKKIIPKFLFRLFESDRINKQFELGANGVTRFGLGIYSINNAYICMPPLNEQKQIANYLDKQTVKIDKIITKNKKLIDLLEEKRVVLINHVVTKGLNPEVPMNESGIEYIGKIPENWEIRKFSHMIELITKGATPTSYGFDFQDEGINFIKVESISKNGEFLPFKFNHISEECNNFLSRSKIKEKDLLFSIAGALGRVAIVNSEILPANTNQALSIIRINNSILLTEYAFYTLKADYIIFQINENTVQSAQANLSMESIKDFKLIIPPISKQMELINFLDNETLKIDKIISKIRKNIHFLEEYKYSLINNVVTGKVDIRGEEI